MKVELITREEYIKRTSYWIRKWELYCGVCGRFIEREWTRIYDEPRPEYWHERNEIDENYICYGCY